MGRMADLSRRRSGVYELRRRVPAALQAALGKKEIRVSLGTKDLREARRARLAKEQEIERLFDAARSPPVTLTNAEVHALRARWLTAKVAANEANPPPEAAVDAELEALQLADDRGQGGALVAGEVDALLAEVGLHSVAPESRKELAERIFWAHVEYLNTMTRRRHGDYSPPPSLKHAPAWPPASAEVPRGDLAVPAALTPLGLPATPSLADLFTLWEAAAPRPAKTVAAFRRRWEDFCASVGPRAPGAITKEDAWCYADALKARALDPATINNGYLGTASAIFGVAEKRGAVLSNPFRGVRVASDWREKARGGRLGFTDEEARRLLAAAHARGGWVWWVSLLLAYTGCRLEEVCGARAGDVRCVAGVWVLDLNIEGEGRSLKNRASIRWVPLHSEVVTAGLPDYARALPAGGPLFPTLVPGKSGRRSDVATKHLARLLRDGAGIADRRKVAAHSWRHRFTTLCRAAGVPDSARKALTGHAAADVSDRYGEHLLPTLAEYVARLPSQR
jgi:integrase